MPLAGSQITEFDRVVLCVLRVFYVADQQEHAYASHDMSSGGGPWHK